VIIKDHLTGANCKPYKSTNNKLSLHHPWTMNRLQSVRCSVWLSDSRYLLCRLHACI